MGANKAEVGVDDDLVNTITGLQRQVTELKTHPQPIGGDVLQVVPSGTGITTFTLASGQHLNGSFTFEPLKPILTLYSVYMTMYVDGTGVNDAHPYGTNITGDKSSVWLTEVNDYLYSDDSTGFRQFGFHVYNYGASSHTITIKCRVNYPIMPLN